MSARLRLAKMLRAAMNEALESRAGLPPITINRKFRMLRRRRWVGDRYVAERRPRQIALPL